MEQLLLQLQSSDNTTRKQAETTYQSQPLVERCRTLVSILCHPSRSLANADDVKSLNFAALLLRHEIETSSKLIAQNTSSVEKATTLQAFVAADRVDEILQLRLRLLFLLSQQSFVDESLRRTCASLAALLVAELDRLAKRTGGSFNSFDLFEPERNFCQHALNLHATSVGEGAFRLLREAPLLMLNSNSTSFVLPIISATLNVVRMQNVENYTTRRHAAASALCSLFLHTATLTKARKSLRAQIETYIPSFLTVVIEAFSVSDATDSNVSQTLLSDFVQLCGTWPRLLETQLESLIQALLNIYAATAPSEHRLLAMEAVVTLCETDASLIKRNCSQLLEPTLAKLVQVIATQIQDDESWYEINANDESDDLDEDAAAAEASLRRLLASFSGKTRRMSFLWTLVKQYAVQMSQTQQNAVNSDDWRLRHAALVLLGCASEGLHTEMESDMSEILPFVLSRLTDDVHARVRYIACTTLSDFCIDFNELLTSAPQHGTERGGEQQQKIHFPQQILSALMQAFSHETCVRVKVAAIDALDDFLDEQALQTYPPQVLDQLLTEFYAGFQQCVPHVVADRSQRIVMESCLQCISSLAENCQKSVFAKYYDLYMPSLKQLIEAVAVNATSGSDFNRLRGRSFISATYCLAASGKNEKTVADAHFILAAMNAQLQFEQQQQNASSLSADTMTSYALYCLDQLCSLLGDQFQPYLPAFMPSLLKQARLSIVEAEAAPKITHSTESDRSTRVAQSDEREDQAQAIKVLATIAASCQFDSVRPFLLDVCDIVLTYSTGETLSCLSADEQVQWRALDALPKLLACARRAFGPSTEKFVDLCRKSLTRVVHVLENAPLYYTISVEPPQYDPNTTVGVAYEALARLIETIGLDSNVFSTAEDGEPKFLPEICRCIKRTLAGCTRIMREAFAAAEEDPAAADVVEELMEDLAASIYDSFVDFHCSFFGTFGSLVINSYLKAGECATADSAAGDGSDARGGDVLPIMLQELSSFAEFRKQYALKIFAAIVAFCFSKKKLKFPSNVQPGDHANEQNDAERRLAVTAHLFCPLVYGVLQKFDSQLSTTELDGVHHRSSRSHRSRYDADEDEDGDAGEIAAENLEDTAQTALLCVGILAKAQNASHLFSPNDSSGFFQQVLPILYSIVNHGKAAAARSSSNRAKKPKSKRKNLTDNFSVSPTIYDSAVVALTAILENLPQVILSTQQSDQNSAANSDSTANYAGICRAWLDLLPMHGAQCVKLQDYQDCCDVYEYLVKLLSPVGSTNTDTVVYGLFAHEFVLFEEVIAPKLVLALNGGSLAAKFPVNSNSQSTVMLAGDDNEAVTACLLAGGGKNRHDSYGEGSSPKKSDSVGGGVVSEEMQARMLSIVQSLWNFVTQNAANLGANSQSLLHIMEGATAVPS